MKDNTSTWKTIEPFPVRKSLFLVNRELDNVSGYLLNEDDLAQMASKTRAYVCDFPETAYLTLARVAELALFTAGNYADSCRFSAAGDLLVNPVKVDVYIQGKQGTFSKQRHMALREQLRRDCGRQESTEWLVKSTFTQVMQKALLPELLETLENRGRLFRQYLEGFKNRMCKVSDTMAFFMAWGIRCREDFVFRWISSSPGEKEFIRKHLCNFDLTIFHSLGKILDDIYQNNPDGHLAAVYKNRDRFIFLGNRYVNSD